MMRRTLGAPLGGTIRGGHQGVESLALSLITPPNFGGGGGSCFPSMVVVASGEPGSGAADSSGFLASRAQANRKPPVATPKPSSAPAARTKRPWNFAFLNMIEHLRCS